MLDTYLSFLRWCAHNVASPRRFFSASLQDADRCAGLVAEFDGLCLDYSRQRVTGETMALLHSLADAANLKGKIADMAAGKHINITEDRAVMHMALRAPKDAVSSTAVNHPPRRPELRAHAAPVHSVAFTALPHILCSAPSADVHGGRRQRGARRACRP